MKKRLGVLIFSLIMQIELTSAQNLAVDEIYQVPLNGLLQTIMVRGEAADLPLLLILHGGPGFSEAMLFRSYNRDLDKHFLVVNWDQRGTNQSYHDSIPLETMTIDQFVADAKVLVDSLKLKYRKEKLFLLGHSWGTVLGMKMVSHYPEDFFAFISVNPMIHGIKNETMSLDYTIREASIRNDTVALNELRKVAKIYPHTEVGLENIKVQRDWLLKMGGVFYGDLDYSALFHNADSNERHLYKSEYAAKGEKLSMEQLWVEIMEVDFFKEVPELRIPIFFLVGMRDYNTPFTITEQFFHSIAAPKKKLIRFRESGHFVPFEEPEKFNRKIKKIQKQVLENK